MTTVFSQELHGTRIILRLLSPEFFVDYLAAFSPRVQGALHVEDPNSELSYLRERIVQMKDDTNVFYCIFDTTSKKLIGAVDIRSPDASRGQLYCWLNEDFWGSGIIQEALALATDEYFSKTNARYLTAHVDVENNASLRALRKFGALYAGYHQGPYGTQHVLMIRKKPNLAL